MNIEVRNDSVLISGYVNAVERLSKPIKQSIGGKICRFKEKIKAGTFKNALSRNDDVHVLLNHREDRMLASTKEGNARLEEDNIGLRAEVEITDKEVIEKAKEGKLKGWSFGFHTNADEFSNDGEQRTVTDMDLVEVSILDDTKEPAYYGTSIESRDAETKVLEIRFDFEDDDADEGKLDYLANKVADLIIAKLAARNDVAEQTATRQAEEEAETEMPSEERAINYSEYEERLAKLTNK